MTQSTPSSAMAGAPLNKFHLTLLACCSFIMFFDGYDLIVYGSVLPTLMNEWSLSPDQAGWLGSAALIGMMCGAVFLGSLADRVGRRPIILHGTLLFSLAAAATALAPNPDIFWALRFITGVFLGGVIPNIVSLMNELAPASKRHTLTTVMLSMYSVGSIIATLIALWVLPLLGWQPIFFISGVSLLLLPVLYRQMPESMAFLMSQGRVTDARRLLTRALPAADHALIDWTVPPATQRASVSVAQLFRSGRALGTPMVWIAFGMCMLMVYGLNTWLPKIMIASGFDLGSSLQFLVVLNVGATAGALAGGWLGDRFGNKKVLVAFFALAVLSLVFLGMHPAPVLLNALLFLAGATTVGTLAVVHAFGADFYPTGIRSTGVSWCSAIGRFGAIAGPILGGSLLALKLPPEQNFLIFAVPGVVAIVAVLLVISPKTASRAKTMQMPEDTVAVKN
ncbi:MFS transporter [Pseudarthrobacter sp.]|uniref:MFS transporter n=1 Tax=Pseudarthrobacter sp. TaxID=1934409 RepID=UPI002FC75847